jgi:hypothetical protein
MINIIILLTIGFILFILAIIFRTPTNYNTVPRKIWTYWHNPDKLPKSVKMCMESWQKYNPDYEITLLTKKNYFGYTTIPGDIVSHPNFNDSPARFSDLVRLYVLTEHGGIWIDASVLVKDPFDKWLFDRHAELSTFYLGGFTEEGFPPVIESWFIACNKNSQFIRLWRDEFSKLAEFPNVEKYIENRKRLGVNFQKIDDPVYLAIHIAAQKVLQIDGYPLDGLILRKAEDGPFKYLAAAKWESKKALQLACHDKKYQTRLIKFRGLERAVLEEEFDYDLSPAKCGWL